VSYEHSATVGKNHVVSQSPSAGAVAHRTEKQGPPVNLVLSLGATPTGTTFCVVPRVKGKSLKATKRALTAAHCEVGKIRRVYSRTVKKGLVVSEKPPVGRKLQDGAKVALTLSKAKRR
jgi:beta-lactam-binding protein with PASTA domain